MHDASFIQRLCFFVRVADEQDVRRLAAASRLLLSAYRTAGKETKQHGTAPSRCTLEHPETTPKYARTRAVLIRRIRVAAGRLLLGGPDSSVYAARRLMQLSLDALILHRCDS